MIFAKSKVNKLMFLINPPCILKVKKYSLIGGGGGGEGWLLCGWQFKTSFISTPKKNLLTLFEAFVLSL